MNMFSLSTTLGFGERATTAGIVTLQGMLTIFLVLIILWIAIEVMHAIIHKKPKDESKKAPAPVAKAAEKTEDAVAVPPTSTAKDDGALIAAITAAIMAARAEDGCNTAFRVVSFKRAGARKRF